jgi:diacylglycerol kinase
MACAKDLGSAAVFLALLWCAITWFLLAGPAFLGWFHRG